MKPPVATFKPLAQAATDTERHRVRPELSALDVARPDEAILRARLIETLKDRRPHEAVSGVGGLARLAAHGVQDPDGRGDGAPRAAKEDQRWCSVAGDIGAARIDQRGDVDGR